MAKSENNNPHGETDKTALEEAIEYFKVIADAPSKTDYERNFKEGVQMVVDRLEQTFLTKDQQQREELVKVYVVQSKKTLIIHGCFSTYERAHRYTNGASDCAIKELKVE